MSPEQLNPSHQTPGQLIPNHQITNSRIHSHLIRNHVHSPPIPITFRTSIPIPSLWISLSGDGTIHRG
jgi:hypothetical protein